MYILCNNDHTWLPHTATDLFLVMKTFQICSRSRFQIHSTALFTTVTVLSSATSPGLVYRLTGVWTFGPPLPIITCTSGKWRESGFQKSQLLAVASAPGREGDRACFLLERAFYLGKCLASPLRAYMLPLLRGGLKDASEQRATLTHPAK